MRERPILFNGEMVRAILEGRKTVTRRIVNPQPSLPTTHWWPSNGHGPMWMADGPSEATGGARQTWGWKECPFGQPGDRLWVRETFAVYGDENKCAIHYRADHPCHVGQKGMGYKPSIHMPRWACRILLEVTDVRVERLQDITEDQARAEGITDGGCTNCGNSEPCGCVCPSPCAVDSFYHLWNSTGGDWDANPWVWAVEFKPVEVRHA